MAKLKELFDFEYGSNFDLSNIENTNVRNGIPYVSRTEKNNGISAYIEKQDDSIKLNQSHTLSVALGGTVLETFYQNEPYYSGYHIGVLKPKNQMTMEEMIFYALCIKENRIKYSYGRQANRTLKDLDLPDYDKLPKWIYDTVKSEFEFEDKKNPLTIDQEKCEDIYLFDLFEISRGKSESISDMILEVGTTPIVSSSDLNNGITGYTSIPPTVKLDKKPCLTLAINGSIGACFYQTKSFIASADVGVLIPKFEINKYNAVYLITLLRNESKLKYSYGRKWSLDALKNTQLKLPTKDGEVDWTLIHEYIKNIESKYKIKGNKFK